MFLVELVGATEEAVHEAETGMPLLYIVFWFIAILLLINLIQYAKSYKVGKTKYDTAEYVAITGTSAALIAFISLMPSILEYHEPLILGIGRFVISASIAALLTLYGYQAYVSQPSRE